MASITGQPRCGPIFTRAKNDVEGIAPGSLGRHLVLADHRRAPDVSFAFRADDRLDPFGLIGGTFYDSELPRHLGVHGGLHRKELAALGIVAGSAFPASGTVSHLPTSICDLTPTILHILGITGPDTMSSRVLHEVLAGGPEAQTSLQSQVFETKLGSFHQTLRRTLIGNTIYLDTASAESQIT
ncbi:hypothetical protein [Labrys sp. ZIDIC5]|uniref:hypothetical protein n=1 Tax=Labrys sedimenti TaxID=3106036 RepID=UPI002ACA5810|nr:hypothetical protein [Labrys sp. ZIDIC5]MDZ5454416.1 hypothetical protein [Labrys sp. ZIDIC5]